MEIRDNYKYLDTHEWVRTEGDIAYIGISAHACEQLGELVYVEIPEIDEDVEKGDEVCVVESVKAASPIYSPVSGTIVEVNQKLEDEPELIQSDPYEVHIFAIRMRDTSELDDLMDAESYRDIASDD